MNKKFLSLGSLLLIFFGINTPLVASAEEGEGEGMESIVSLSIGGELLLKKVPNFSFGTISNDGTAQKVNLPEEQSMIVSDNTGLGESWRVTVSFMDTKFKDSKIQMKIKPEADSALTVAGPEVQLAGDEASVLQASSASSYSKDMNEYTFSYAAGESNQLIIPEKAKSGAYKTMLKWDLESTP
ncbi:MAG TPA: hypothetical protein DHV18_09600 [Brochothrix thermosphacta]|nr:hypothetical protein [Brochothrix thermosphacta]